MSKSDELKKLAVKITGKEPTGRRAGSIVEFIADEISGDAQNTNTISDSIAYLTDVYEGGGSDVEINDGYYLFNNKHRLDNLELLSKNLKITNANNMFSFTNNLTTEEANILNTYIPLIDFSNCTDFTSTFQTCAVTDYNINTSKATTITQMFQNSAAINLSILDLSSLTSNVGLSNTFSGCRDLTNNSLQNILKSLLTLNSSYAGTKLLKNIGINSVQATTCTSFPEWTTLSANGWTTGY